MFWASAPGNDSFSPSNGVSHFVHYLCQNLDQFGKICDLEFITRRANRDMCAHPARVVKIAHS